MEYATMGRLGLFVFVLVFVSFLVRGFGQFVVGQRAALQAAAPIALAAALLAVVLVAYWVLARVGITTLEDG